ncbi:FAD-binding oxidoreductase [Salinibius halmophilus]|uniref:FAD-binding oxidoreductase n=1 Tax=Salinibius halmophilus TaxID=1853216 RepID=UPI000E6600FE|nr:FAD-binding oxidoreductase [Salinibius halmophilus]
MDAIAAQVNELFSAELPNTKWATDDETRREFALALNGSECLPAAVVWPTTEEEISQVFAICNQHKIAVHPVAQGRNWGYGTAQGTSAGQIILHLKHFNKVLEVNESLAYMRVQAGVSQQDAYDALVAADSGLQLDITAAGKHASVVGNVLERGFGHTDYSDRFANVLAMKVLLPTGQIIETGMNMVADAKAKHVYPYGVGPVINGLFSQSNLGVVLEMTIALQPKPEYNANAIVLVRDADVAPKLVATIAKLKKDGVVSSGVHTASLARALGEKTKNAPGQWITTASFSGPKKIALARYKHFKRELNKAVPGLRILLLNDFRWKILSFLNRSGKIPPIAQLEQVLDLKLGRPTDIPLKTLLDFESAHSQLKTHEFPACFRWICAVSTAEQSHLELLMQTCREVFNQFGYGERYTLTNVSPRAVVLIANIRYERTQEEIEKASRFYHALDKALIEAGFPPYRSGSGMFDAVRPYVNEENLAVLQTIKQGIDPNNILSPGKYWIDHPAVTEDQQSAQSA